MEKEYKLDNKTIQALKQAQPREEGVYTEEEARKILNMLKKKRPGIDGD